MLAGIDAAAAAGFDSLKLDTVVIRGVNDDEIVPLLEYARGVGAEVRFIEYMDVGGATRWTPRAVVSRREMLARIEAQYGTVLPLDTRRRRRPIASSCPTAPRSASSRRRPSRSVRPAIGAA